MGTWNVVEWRKQQLQGIWVAWIQQNWQSLVSGLKINAHYGLAAPPEAGFEAIGFAHPVGQIRDWGLSMTDGSRIHVHEYADGRRVVHRDKHDPKRGLGPALAHLMQETPYGMLALGCGALALITQASNA
jgi:hypothetical protein